LNKTYTGEGKQKKTKPYTIRQSDNKMVEIPDKIWDFFVSRQQAEDDLIEIPDELLELIAEKIKELM